MKLIALHILQPFPTTCLNRDDVGAPKNLIFGGATRARVSSQCWKRQIRMLAKSQDFADTYNVPRFVSDRTARVADGITCYLTAKHKLDAKSIADPLARGAAHYLATIDPKNESETKTMMLLSPTEYETIADILAALPAEDRQSLLEGYSRLDRIALEADEDEESVEPEDEPGSTTPKTKRTKDEPKPLKPKDYFKLLKKVLKKPLEQRIGAGLPRDAADIAIFGRMVANDGAMTVEGAGLFAHAFSTHKCDNDLDFWTAVDDKRRAADGPGADNMNHAEFNSACYYRYVALNLDQLFYQKDENGELTSNLRGLMKPEDVETRRDIVRAFLLATLLAVPTAKQNSMNGHSLPEFALGVVSTGQPFQLANAFEKPVSANGDGWLQPSVEVLEKHYGKLKKVFSLEAFEGNGEKRTRTAKSLIREEVRLSEETPLDTFIEKLVAHVH